MPEDVPVSQNPAQDQLFGQMPDGRDVRLLTIGAEPGSVVEVLTLGAEETVP